MIPAHKRRERADLAHTVDVMVDLGLTYLQTKNLDGTYQYQIEPDINILCNFKGISRYNGPLYTTSSLSITIDDCYIFCCCCFCCRKSTNKRTDLF